MEATGDKQKGIMRGWNQRNIAYWRGVKRQHFKDDFKGIYDVDIWYTQEQVCMLFGELMALRQENEKLQKRVVRLEKRVIKLTKE